MILEFLSLPFDPSDGDAEIRKIFDDDLARTLWLGIRQGHIVEKNFKKAILAYTEVIRPIKDQESFGAKELFDILSGSHKRSRFRVIGESEKTFVEELLPFIKGGKAIKFEIKKK